MGSTPTRPCPQARTKAGGKAARDAPFEEGAVARPRSKPSLRWARPCNAVRSEPGLILNFCSGTYHIKIGCAACGECCGPVFHEADFGDAPAIELARINAEADFADAVLNGGCPQLA